MEHGGQQPHASQAEGATTHRNQVTNWDPAYQTAGTRLLLSHTKSVYESCRLKTNKKVTIQVNKL